MKIAIVNYSELNERPAKEQIINDICRLYSNASRDSKEDMGSVLNSQLTELSSARSTNHDYDVFYVDTSDSVKRSQLKASISSYNPDLLVSYNLAGFELGTLADSLLYNLIDCRQFHIVKKKALPNEKYLSKLRSLNLFIFEDYKE